MEGKVKNSLKLPLPSSIIIDCTVTARYSLSSIIYEKNDVTPSEKQERNCSCERMKIKMENKKETLTAAEEQKRQQQFIEKARIYVREKSEELGRPLYACTTTFGSR